MSKSCVLIFSALVTIAKPIEKELCRSLSVTLKICSAGQLVGFNRVKKEQVSH